MEKASMIILLLTQSGRWIYVHHRTLACPRAVRFSLRLAGRASEVKQGKVYRARKTFISLWPLDSDGAVDIEIAR